MLIGIVAFRAIGSIIGAVANSMQESQIIIQLLYFPMLFLGGATFPIAIMPNWLQIVAQFIPTTYLSTGITAILEGHETIWNNLAPAGALVLTAIVGTFLALKLFRWEKDEKMRASAKFWLDRGAGAVPHHGRMASLRERQHGEGQVLARVMSRTAPADSRRAAVSRRRHRDRAGLRADQERKNRQIYTGAAPDAKSLKAEGVDAAGKRLLPGLIDVHVHLGNPAGSGDPRRIHQTDTFIDRELAAYLFSGVTAVKSLGDATDLMLQKRAALRNGEKDGAELFAVGPMFTAPGGHGTEYAQYLPEAMRAQFQAQLVRLPKSPEEARKQVDDLKQMGVDGIKAILEGGVPGRAIPRLDPALLRAIAEQARADNLPIVCHTGNAHDVADALDAGESTASSTARCAT